MAVELLERAVQVAPTPLNRLFLGQAYFYADEPEAAIENLTGALDEGRAAGLAERWLVEGEDILLRLGVESE